MANLTKPITSAHLKLRVETASLVVGQDEAHLVLPAIDFESEDAPPKTNLNTDPSGPRVLRVDVHCIDPGSARRSYGHSGVERLSLFLTRTGFEQWVGGAQGLGRRPLDLEAKLDEHGDIVQLLMNGELGDAPL